MTRRSEWAALVALVLLSTAFRAWAAVEVPVPWIAPDEMVYGMLGRSLWLHGSLAILGGPTPYYSLLTPLLAGFPLAAFGLGTGYDLLQGLQALVMSLAAVPVFLWARTLVPRWSALTAAALTLATPALAYSGLVMTEVLFYPLLVTAAWAGAAAIARPTRANQILLLAAFVAVCATRIQAIVLVPALVTAALLDAFLARSWGRLRRQLPAAVGLAVLLAGWAVWRLATGKGALGGYDVVASTSYSVGAAARFVLYHGASLLILCGLFPLAAVAVKLVEGLRRGEQDERVRAYLAVTASLCVWVVLEVGAFASRYSDRIVERNLIGLAPVLFIGLVLWLARGPDGGYVVRGAVAAGALAVLLILPVRRYVDIYGMHDALTLIPMFKLSTLTSLSTMAWVYRAVAVAAAAAFAFVPRRGLQWVPFALIVALVAASVVSSRFVVDEARAQQRAFLGDDPSWADHAGGVAHRLPLRRRAVVAGRVGDSLLQYQHRPGLRPQRRDRARAAAAGRRDGAPGRDGGGAAVAPGQDEVRDRVELDQAARRAEGRSDPTGAEPDRARPLEARAAAPAPFVDLRPGAERRHLG